MVLTKQILSFYGVVLAGMFMTACSSVNLNDKAPVEDRRANGSSLATSSLASSSTAPAGHYIVRPGDTLIRIGLEHGVSWRDLSEWNGLANADVIEVGQTIRVTPPGVATGQTGAMVDSSTAKITPIPNRGGDGSQTVQRSNVVTVPVGANSSIQLIWPANGPLIAGFNEASNKGYDIGGKEGDPVVAAADGQVVYAGAGLRGYGNLIIIKHNEHYLTAYAHNQALLVKEDQRVKRGQQIAKMGKTDSDRVKLHFEVRKQGKPVNPVNFLPKR